MTETERLLSRFPENSIGIEIGVWEGDFSERLLGQLRPRHLHLVDPWRFFPEPRYERARYGGGRAHSQADMDALHAAVLARFATEIEARRVSVHRQTSAEAAPSFADQSLDWVYVDGDHHYEFVRADLHLYWPKLRPGGLLTGDDYVADGWWRDDVIRAVDRFAAREQVGVELFGRRWLIRKPPSARRSAIGQESRCSLHCRGASPRSSSGLDETAASAARVGLVASIGVGE